MATVKIPIRDHNGLVTKIVEAEASDPLLGRIAELERANTDLIGRINFLEKKNGQALTNLRAENKTLVEAVATLEAVATAAIRTAGQAIRTASEAATIIESALGLNVDPRDTMPRRPKTKKMDANERALNAFAAGLRR